MTNGQSAIGSSIRRIEGGEKVTGSAIYVADVDLPATVYARLVLSPHAHARITAVSTDAAEAVEGVLAVLSGHQLAEAKVLAEDEVFYAGQPVAVVVATDSGTATDAAELVEVDYEPLPVVSDPIQAMDPTSPLTRTGPVEHLGESEEVHGAAAGGSTAQQGKPRNVNNAVRYRRGDPERALRDADIVIEQTFQLAAVHQGYMEAQNALAQVSFDGSMQVWASTQGQFYTRQVTAERLGLPEHRVTVHPMTVGGGFGAKALLLEPLAAELSRRVRRPVSIVLDRTQDFTVSTPGPGAIFKLRLGAKRDGTPLVLCGEIIFDSGAAPGVPLGISAMFLGGTYRIPHLDIHGFEVLTHKSPVGAYRAPGAPQAYFAIESLMDELARETGIDPIELRLRHAAREGDDLPDGRKWPRIGLVECLEAVRDHPFWRDRQNGSGIGYGIAAGGWMGGMEPSAAGCRVNTDGSLTIQVGSVDISGVNTTFRLIAAEVFDMDPNDVQVVQADTDAAPYAGVSGGSKTIYSVGAAVMEAAEDARRQLLDMAAERLEIGVEDLEMHNGRVSVIGVPDRSVTVAELAQASMQFGGSYPPVSGFARNAVDKQSPGFAVHVARVEVDEATGHIRTTGYLAVQDVGRALNPAEVRGQIHGGVAQGIGRALYEELVYDDAGQLLDGTFADYGIPSAGDIPEIQVELVEVPSPYGPFGAKGVGEPPVIPVAAAMANAVREALDVRIGEVPMTPEIVTSALRTRGR